MNNKRKLQETLIALNFGTQSVDKVVYKIKREISPDLVSQNISKICSNKRLFSHLMPDPFPKHPKDVLSKDWGYLTYNYVNEFLFACHICIRYETEINKIEKLREKYFNCFMLGKYEDSKLALIEIVNEFGWSVWIIRAFQLLEQYVELGSSYSESIIDTENDRGLLNFIVTYTKHISQNSIHKSTIQQELNDAFTDQHPIFKIYFEAKLHIQPIRTQEQCLVALHFDSRSSLIDFYDSFIILIQVYSSILKVKNETDSIITAALKNYQRYNKDIRLQSALRALDININPNIDEHYVSAENIIELYTEGKYIQCQENILVHLDSYPMDINIIELLAKCAARSFKELKFEYDCILSRVSESLLNIIVKNDNTFRDATDLLSISFRYSIFPWASALHLIVDAQLSPPQILKKDIATTYYLISMGNCTPLSFGSMSHGVRKYFERTLRETGLYRNTIALIEIFEIGSTPSTILVDKNRQIFYLSFFFGKNERWKDAIETILRLDKSSSIIDLQRGKCFLAYYYLMDKNIEKCLEVVVATYFENSQLRQNLPIRGLLKILETPEVWPKTIYLPLFFEICCTLGYEKNRALLRVSFENFQIDNHLKDATHVMELDYPEKYKIEYLKRVWLPKTMQQTMLYDGSREIEEERVNICKKMIELDVDNTDKYVTEIRDRIKNLEINKAIKLIESSKVYVDIETITKSLKSTLNDSYERYKLSSKKENYKEVLDLKEKVHHLLGDFSGTLKILGVNYEADLDFNHICNEIINQFLVGEHGLNSYLSTQVRHGTIDNTLRKPVEDQNLILIYDERKEIYNPNEHWNRLFSSNDSNDSMKFNNLLIEFSKNYDALIKYIKNTLLQIKYFRQNDSKTNTDALFVYRLSQKEALSLQSKIFDSESIDDVIDTCIDWLWSITDKNLEVVRNELNTTVRNKFYVLFDELTSGIQALNIDKNLVNINNAIAMSRSNLELRLQEVISWFERNEVYERQDYELEFPAQIALQIILNTKSGISERFKIHVSREEPGIQIQMPGRTLDGFVYIFIELYENAINNSILDMGSIDLRVNLSKSNDEICISVINSVNMQNITSADLERINISKSQLGKDIGLRKVQEEGGTGFFKIFKTLSTSIYRDSSLNFGINEMNKTFEVELKFKVNI